MVSSSQNVKSAVSRAVKITGLRFWMLRVLEECDRAAAGFAPDPVHDLRVALRRCRSLADGLMAIDPDPDWKAMKKAGKRLFQRLGALRDIQVMTEWIEKLAPAPARIVGAGEPSAPFSAGSPVPPQSQHDFHDIENAAAADNGDRAARDPVALALLQILAHREAEQKREAESALEEDEFDRKQWKQWCASLPPRAARVRPGSALLKHLALERWAEAHRLHQLALRNRSQTAFHSLRIGIKRFRYIVENFLPVEHAAWSRDLKELQDLLGEVHDLDVLWATAVSCHVFSDHLFPDKVFSDHADSAGNLRKQWRSRILQERNQRINRYRKKMVGPRSLWPVFRQALPKGKQVQALATRRMKLWAKSLDPDFAHSERVARLALQLYDGLIAAGLLVSAHDAETNGAETTGAGARSSLLAAALLHDVGKSKGNKGHHKASSELIRAHGTPLGWKPEDMRRAAIVARFHCGALPTKNHKALRDLLPNEQKITIQLAAILRLANAMDVSHDGHIRRIQIENLKIETKATRKNRTNGFLRKPPSGLARNEALVIAAEGYAPNTPTAQAIAAERHLLETVLHRPVVVRPMKKSAISAI